MARPPSTIGKPIANDRATNGLPHACRRVSTGRLLVKAGAHLNNGKPFEPEQIEMIYWFADFPDEPARFPYTSAQFKRDWDTLTKLAEEIASASSYPLTDDRQKCAYCTYRSYCERGIRAGDMDQAEAEMEAEELFDVNFEQIGEIAF